MSYVTFPLTFHVDSSVPDGFSEIHTVTVRTVRAVVTKISDTEGLIAVEASDLGLWIFALRAIDLDLLEETRITPTRLDWQLKKPFDETVSIVMENDGDTAWLPVSAFVGYRPRPEPGRLADDWRTNGILEGDKQ